MSKENRTTSRCGRKFQEWMVKNVGKGEVQAPLGVPACAGFVLRYIASCDLYVPRCTNLCTHKFAWYRHPKFVRHADRVTLAAFFAQKRGECHSHVFYGDGSGNSSAELFADRVGAPAIR